MRLLLLLWGAVVAAAPPIVLRHVTVVDTASGRSRANQSILVEDGRIKRIGRTQRVRVPAGGEAVEARGKFVIPGLWDMHVHFRGGEKLIPDNETWLALFIANGITGVREMGGDFTPTVLQWRDEIAAGKRLGPRIVTSGPKLDGPKPAWPGSIPVGNPDEAGQAVETVQRMGAGFVKIYFSAIGDDTYKAIIDEAHKRKLQVTGHLPWDMLATEAVDAGQDGIEHISWYLLPPCSSKAEELRAEFRKSGWSREQYFAKLLATFSADRAHAMLEQMARRGTTLTPTLTVGRTIASMNSVDYENDPRRRYITPGIWDTWSPKSGRRRPPSEESLRIAKLRDQRGTELVLMAEKLGVRLLAGSDSGASNNFVFPGWSLHDELEALVKAGLTPLESLQCATRNAASWFGWTADYGSVSEGKVADMVLLDADPLADIRNTRKIAGVVRRGEYLPRQGLDALLDQVAEKVRDAK